MRRYDGLMSRHRPAAIDDKWRAGRKRCVVTGKEQRRARDLIRLADPSEQRDSTQAALVQAAFTLHPLHHRRVDRAGTDRVHADVVSGRIQELRRASTL